MFQRLQQQSAEAQLQRLEGKLLRLEHVIADTSQKLVALQNTGQEREMEQLNQQIRLQSAEHATITRKCGDLERRLTELANGEQRSRLPASSKCMSCVSKLT